MYQDFYISHECSLRHDSPMGSNKFDLVTSTLTYILKTLTYVLKTLTPVHISLVVVLSLRTREVINLSPAWTGRAKTFKIDSDFSFAKSTAFRSENHRSFRYHLQNGGPVSQSVWHVKETSLLKTVNGKNRSKSVMLTVAR
jgi:hypothetical protein